jgi:hypothetical protein
MLLDRVPIAVPSRRPQIDDGSVQPAPCHICKTHARLRGDTLSPTTPDEQLVTNGPRCSDPAVHCAPTLPTVDILEADLVHP